MFQAFLLKITSAKYRNKQSGQNYSDDKKLPFLLAKFDVIALIRDFWVNNYPRSLT